jgi:predicted secreted acid phosphatase
MKLSFAISLIVTLLFIGCGSSPENLTNAKKEVINYYENGAYHAELTEIVNNGLERLEEKNLPEKPLIIFDVDETALSNYEYIKSIDFGYIPELWVKYLKREEADAIPEIQRIYNWAMDNEVSVAFLTGRTHDAKEATYNNLKAEGYSKFDTLICRRADEEKVDASTYKENHRLELINKGYNIIASVGDQKSDLEGDHSGIKIRVPNYLYIVD